MTKIKSNSVLISALNNILLRLDLKELQEAITEFKTQITNGNMKWFIHEQKKIEHIEKLLDLSTSLRELVISEESIRTGKEISTKGGIVLAGKPELKTILSQEEKTFRRPRIIDMKKCK